jgi:hypothetical protein
MKNILTFMGLLCYKSIHIRTTTSRRRESRENREWTRRCNPGPAASEVTSLCRVYATGPIGLGRQAGEGEPEDLSGCSRTVFGAKILCGLISLINPQS